MKKVGDLARQFLQEKGWANGNPYDPLFRGWASVAGEGLATHSRLVDVRQGCLLVEVDHPGWLQLAQLRKAALLAAARRAAPLADIGGVRFRIGSGEASPDTPH